MFEMCKVISNGLFTSNKICLNLRQFGIPEREFVKKPFVSMEVSDAAVRVGQVLSVFLRTENLTFGSVQATC